MSVLAEDPPAERCELSADWDDYPIPEDIARKHLGIRLHASLSAPYSGTNAFQVLKPRTEEMLCHAAEAKDMESQRLAAFEAGTDKAAFIRQRKYSFPVFSENYRTAIFVVTHMRLGWYRSARGVARLPLEADWSAVVYRKVGGQWRNVDRIGLAAT
ncbi:hypothetical protein BRADO4711 [Bradyrhizobium sp. ORS 278]|nr:hypothetical protein BRADO4711 [Bradyrhizobium sp. ORS 278]